MLQYIILNFHITFYDVWHSCKVETHLWLLSAVVGRIDIEDAVFYFVAFRGILTTMRALLDRAQALLKLK